MTRAPIALYPSLWRGQRHAFTLIELVVVMAVTCLMLGMAIPLFNSTLAQMRADSAVQEVAMTLRLANQKSVFLQTKHDLVVDFKEQSFWLEFLQPGKHSKKLKMRPDQTRTLSGGFQFLLVYFPSLDDSENRHNARVSFYPDGTATDSIVFIGRVSPKDPSTYDSLFGIEIRSGDGRVRILTEEERKNYDYLL